MRVFLREIVLFSCLLAFVTGIGDRGCEPAQLVVAESLLLAVRSRKTAPDLRCYALSLQIVPAQHVKGLH